MWSYFAPAHNFFYYVQGKRSPRAVAARTTMSAMTKREYDDEDRSAKRVKTEANGDGNGNGNMKAANPYLAHWNDGEANIKGEYGSASGLDGFKRHATTSKQAKLAEDGPNNPFTGRPLSSKYMSILKKRRDLPVHQQRYASCL